MNATPLPALVDELTEIKTQIAVLEAREKELSRQLIDTGLPEICGMVTRAKVIVTPDSPTYDYKAACYALLSDVAMAPFVKVKKGSTCVKIFGYN